MVLRVLVTMHFLLYDVAMNSFTSMMLDTQSVSASRMKALTVRKQPEQTVNDINVKSITTNLQIEILEYQLRLDIIFLSQTTMSLQKYT